MAELTLIRHSVQERGLVGDLSSADAITPILDAYTIALWNTKAVAKAAILVENINGPVLLISGSRDEMWPSTALCEQIMARLAEAKFQFSYKHLALETGHSVMEDKHCWPEIVRFLREEFLGILSP